VYLLDNYWIHFAVFAVVIIAFVLIMAMALIYIERRFVGFIQVRLGPNRTGPFGVLQPVADAIKVLLKEDIIPAKGDKLVFWLAPLVAFVPALMIFAVVPFQRGALLADLNIGILYVVAVSSVAAVGVFMAGWSSSNKYSLVGAMRDVAQLISYEIPLGLAILSVVLLAGSLSLTQIVEAQSIPFILLQPLGFLIFFIAALAEVNRTPFDLLEADSEIVAGFNIEYSGMKFALFYLAEYCEALVLSALVATLFLGGWKGPLLPPFLWFIIKIVAVFMVVVWIRGTIPRLRIDQVMGFAWKGLLPLALINLLITALEVLVWKGTLPWLAIFLNIAIMAVLILKGLSVTLRNLLRGPITTQYPEQKLDISRRARGTKFAWDEDKCIGCYTCARSCPISAIEIETPETAVQGEIVAPCRDTCPAGVDAARYVRLIAQGKFADALAVIRERIPFPSVCGFVCAHPCEDKCNRGKIDQPITIRALKRFAWEHDNGLWRQKGKQLPPTGKKVAVVGAGPAGLTAGYYLAKQGHKVTAFESLSIVGGMIRVGIPDYRLPPKIIDDEIDEIKRVGVEIKLNTKVESVDKLLQDGYDAVLIAVGAHRGVKIPLPGQAG